MEIKDNNNISIPVTYDSTTQQHEDYTNIVWFMVGSIKYGVWERSYLGKSWVHIVDYADNADYKVIDTPGFLNQLKLLVTKEMKEKGLFTYS